MFVLYFRLPASRGFLLRIRKGTEFQIDQHYDLFSLKSRVVLDNDHSNTPLPTEAQVSGFYTSFLTMN